MWNNTPLENLFLAVKHGTVHFSSIYAIALALLGLFLVGASAALGMAVLLHAGFVYWCGQSIKLSLEKEAKARRLAASDDAA